MQEIEQFVRFLRYEKRYSPLTVQAYTKDLEQFFIFIGDHFETIPLSKAKHLHIRSWLAELKESGIDSRSINRKISTLKSFYKYLLQQQIITVLPTNKIIAPKTAKKLPSFVHDQQMPDILRHFSNDENDFSKQTKRLIVELLYASGMRRAELLNLKHHQIEFENKLIRVIGKGNKERLIPMTSETIVLIKYYLQLKQQIPNADQDYLLIMPNGKRIYEKYIYNTVKQVLSLYTTLEKNSPHVLRHSFATHLLNNGAEINAIKELLGHASLAATQVYTHNSIEKLKNIYKKAHPKG